MLGNTPAAIAPATPPSAFADVRISARNKELPDFREDCDCNRDQGDRVRAPRIRNCEDGGCEEVGAETLELRITDMGAQVLRPECRQYDARKQQPREGSGG